MTYDLVFTGVFIFAMGLFGSFMLGYLVAMRAWGRAWRTPEGWEQFMVTASEGTFTAWRRRDKDMEVT